MNSVKENPMLQKAQHIWTMLDELAEKNPESYKNFISKQLNEGREYARLPEPHMCIKTTILKASSNKTDVMYVNFFAWNRVPAPVDDNAPIPVTGGKILQDGDNNRIVAVAFNEKVLETYGIDCQNREEQHMLIQLAFRYLEDQNEIKLSDNYSILPKDNSTVFGNKLLLINSLTKKNQTSDTQQSLTRSQGEFVLSSPASLLAQIGTDFSVNEQHDDNSVLPSILSENKAKSASNSKSPLIEELSATNTKLPIPEYKLYVKRKDDLKSSFVILEIRLPGVTSVGECELDISAWDAHLFVANKYELNVTFPTQVDESSPKAKFSKKSFTLTVTMSSL